MTENYPQPVPQQAAEPPAPLADQADPSTAEVVREQAADVGHSGVEAGKHAAEVAGEQAAGVVAEAGRQGRDLLRQAQDQATEQAARGQQRAAGGLLTLADDLRLMADRVAPGSPAGELARRAAVRARAVGQWLDSREPGQVLDEVQDFARRKPGMFLALAAGAGLLGGRLTRGMQGAASDGWSAATTEPEPEPAWEPEPQAAPAPGQGPLPAPVEPGTVDPRHPQSTL